MKSRTVLDPSCLLMVVYTVAAWLLLQACSDARTGEESGPSLAELPELYAKVQCDELESCLGEEFLKRIFGEETCLDRVQNSIEDGDFFLLQHSIEAGYVEYNSQNVMACIESIKGAGCSLNTTRLFEKGACDKVLVGYLELGSDCTNDAECAGSAFCKRANDCPGICRVLLQEGESCRGDSQCEEGLSCSSETDTCIKPKVEGKSCGGFTGDQCELGLLCMGSDQEKGVSGTCKLREKVFNQKLGQTCDLESALLCKEGLACALSLDDAGIPLLDKDLHVVFNCVEKSTSGGSCAFGAPSHCPDDEYCDVDPEQRRYQGECQPLPEEGERCIDSMGVKCRAGLYCDAKDGCCHEVKRPGESCISDKGCTSGFCKSGTCARLPQCEI